MCMYKRTSDNPPTLAAWSITTHTKGSSQRFGRWLWIYFLLNVGNSTTFFSHAGRFHDFWNMSIILCGPLEQTGNIHLLLFIHSRWTWKLGWSYTPNVMRKNYCSSHDFSPTRWSSQYRSVLITMNINTIVTNTDTIRNILTIQTDIIHNPYRPHFLLIFYMSSHEGKTMEAHVKC